MMNEQDVVYILEINNYSHLLLRLYIVFIL